MFGKVCFTPVGSDCKASPTQIFCLSAQISPHSHDLCGEQLECGKHAAKLARDPRGEASVAKEGRAGSAPVLPLQGWLQSAVSDDFWRVWTSKKNFSG